MYVSRVRAAIVLGLLLCGAHGCARVANTPEQRQRTSMRVRLLPPRVDSTDPNGLARKWADRVTAALWSELSRSGVLIVDDAREQVDAALEITIHSPEALAGPYTFRLVSRVPSSGQTINDVIVEAPGKFFADTAQIARGLWAALRAADVRPPEQVVAERPQARNKATVHNEARSPTHPPRSRVEDSRRVGLQDGVRAGPGSGLPALRRPASFIVLDFSSEGNIPDHVPKQLLRLLLAQLHRVDGAKTWSPEDIETMLGVERQKDLLGCTTSVCMAEIGGALGADYVVTGTIGQIGSQNTISVSVIESTRATVKARVSQTTSANEDALVQAIPGVATSIVLKLNE